MGDRRAQQALAAAQTRLSQARSLAKLLKQAAPEKACDVMIDTGMNRLGLRPDEIAVLDGLLIDTLHSHLACADEDHLEAYAFSSRATTRRCPRLSSIGTRCHSPPSW